MRKWIRALTALSLGVAILTPASAYAQRSERQSRESMAKWQKLAYAGAAAAIFGEVTKDKGVKNLGLATGLYSVYRMEEDRKSRD